MTKTSPLNGLVCFAVAACLVACSDSSGGNGNGVVGVDEKGVCTNELDPCGGDLSGDWKVTTTCFVTLPECTGSYTATMLPTTTFSFQSNGMLQLTAMGSSAVSTIEDLACTGVTHCADLDDANAGRTCLAQGAASCVCTATGTVSNSSTTAYSVAGNKLTLSVGTDSVQYSFCKKGNTLTLRLDLLGLIYTLERP